jgi:hypothetical protein
MGVIGVLRILHRERIACYTIWQRKADFRFKGWCTRNVLSSVLHDKVRLTDKTDAKHAATLLMLSLSVWSVFPKTPWMKLC